MVYFAKKRFSMLILYEGESLSDKKSMRGKVVNKTYTDWFSKDENTEVGT